MDYVCGDNRFEIIERYKNELISATNIESSPDEMAVLDNILFRFWQMGWLKEQEAREPHYTILRYRVDGTEVAIQHPECPRCIENGLVLWDAEIEKGQAYCKRCGQAVKWDG